MQTPQFFNVIGRRLQGLKPLKDGRFGLSYLFLQLLGIYFNQGFLEHLLPLKIVSIQTQVLHRNLLYPRTTPPKTDTEWSSSRRMARYFWDRASFRQT